MVSDRKLANVVGGKSARPCDNCIRKRARWYCAADDAFLCQSCDSSVHSANALSRRHERVLLNTASIKSKLHESTTWHKGFTTKARTPRHKKKMMNISRFSSDDHEPLFQNTVIDDSNGKDSNINNHLHLVPEICIEETSHGENDRVQLLYRVPIFEPFDSHLCTSNEPVDSIQGSFNKDGIVSNDQSCRGDDQDMMMNHHLQGFLPSESDLAELGADVESLLDLGLLDSKACEGFVKVEDDDEEVDYNNMVDDINVVDQSQDEDMLDVGREAFDQFNFGYDSPIAEKGNKDRILEPTAMNKENYMKINFGDIIDDDKGFFSKKTFLRLDYEGVLLDWDGNKSPWITGERPDFDSGDCYRPDCMGTCGTLMHMYRGIGRMSAHVASMADVIGREARVSRYREKRRTRLFSKKIRYEVRKLNAEKRPRMKGRFVKRSNLVQ